MARFLVPILVLFLLPTSKAASCNDTLANVFSLCPSAAFGSQNAQPNMTVLCDDSTCNSALLAVSSSCAGDPRGQTYAVLLSMCQPCQRAAMHVGRTPTCVTNSGPDPAQACSAICQPQFCNAISSCPNGSSWPAMGASAQDVSQHMALVRSLLSSCPCNAASTSPPPSTSAATSTLAQTTTSTSVVTSTPALPVTCTAPFKVCGAWGDPHFTSSFYGSRFDFMGLGLFTLATTVDNSFELQGFQCRFGGSRAAVFAGFALKVAGSYVTIVGSNVSIDGSPFTGGSNALGLNVVGSTISLDSDDNCAHFETKKAQHSFSPGFYHNMNVEIADSRAAFQGVCGSSSGRQPVPRSDAFFSTSELDSLCQMCGLRNCVRRLGARRLEMSAPDNWVPASTARDACTTAGIAYEAAALKCQKLQSDTAFFEACIYDFCSSDGDEALVQNAIDSKQREVARAKRFSASVDTPVASTTTSLRGDTPMSFAPKAAPLSIWVMFVFACSAVKLVW